MHRLARAAARRLASAKASRAMKIDMSTPPRLTPALASANTGMTP
jgi:hypothetical protein